MEILQALTERYEKYLQEVEKLYSRAKPTDGLFGWGDDPRKDPCHLHFYEDVEGLIGAFAASQPDAREAYPAVRYVLEAPAACRDSACFWFMFAAQGLIRVLIPLLNPQQCAQLRQLYDDLYPKRDRLPVQRDLYKQLKKGAGSRL